MKQKTVVTLTFDPKDYRVKGTAKNAVRIVIQCLLGMADWPEKTRITVRSGKESSHWTRLHSQPPPAPNVTVVRSHLRRKL